MLNDSVPYDPVQGQGQGLDHRCLKVAKMADFKVCLLRQWHIIKRQGGL